MNCLETDPRTNPSSPGAGTPPPKLAGRDDVIGRAEIALDRIRNRYAARSFILYGLRGVGRTVLLNRIRLDAEARGLVGVKLEAPEERSLPATLALALRASLIKLDRGAAAKSSGARALRALAGFAKALKVKYHDIEAGIEIAPEPGLVDSGDLDADLAELVEAVGDAARERGTAIVIYIDELQFLRAAGANNDIAGPQFSPC